MKWIVKPVQSKAEKLAEGLGISEVFAGLLFERGITEPEQAKRFLKPDLGDFEEFASLDTAKKAYAIIEKAIKENKKIVVYGDYDVDGVMSTVILVRGLKDLGARTEYYIPDRFSEGYGLNMKAVSDIHDRNADVIICCDNGISAVEECGYIKDLGMELIILDHHTPHRIEDREVLPVSDVIIDMKLENSAYGFKEFCAGGLCYRFINGLYSYLGKKIEKEAELFIFAAIATICDMVELKGENRIFAHLGLRLINSRKNTNPGLREILMLQNALGKPVNDYTIGFVVGPFINSAGRMGKAVDYADIFLSEDIGRVRELSAALKVLSDERKRLTGEAAEKVLDSLSGKDPDKVIVVYNPDIHESLAGLVAGRVKEVYNRPVIVLTKGENAAKGSGRSIDGYDMFMAVNNCRDLLIKYGGHRQAVGLTIDVNKIDELRERLNRECSLSQEDMEAKIYIDRLLGFSEIDMELCKEIEYMRPFGKGNPEPIFATKGVYIKNVRFVGKERRYVQFVFYEGGRELRGVSFSLFDKLRDFALEESGAEGWEGIYYGGQRMQFFADIVYRIEKNSYNGRDSVQIRLIDFKKSQ